jgi:hypothetical protein
MEMREKVCIYSIRRFENDGWHETSDKDTTTLRRRP